MRKKPKDPPPPNELDYSPQQALEDLCEIIDNYATYVEAPRIFAQRRRRAGDPTASPRDYDCCCQVDDDDFAPRCAGRRRNCKFAHRPDPQPNFKKGKATHEISQARVRTFLARLQRREELDLSEIVLRMPREIEKAARRRRKLARDNAECGN